LLWLSSFPKQKGHTLLREKENDALKGSKDSILCANSAGMMLAILLSTANHNEARLLSLRNFN